MFKNALILFISISLPMIANAGLTAPEREHLAVAIKIYQVQTTIKGYLKELKSPATPEASAFLHKMTDVYENAKLAKVSFDGVDTIKFDIYGKENSITFKSIEEGKYTINHRDVEISNLLPPLKRWEALISSLAPTKAEKSALLRMLVPEAHAIDETNYERFAGPGVMVAGAVLLKDFELKWKSRTNVFGITLLVIGTAMVDESLCENIRQDRASCYGMEDSINLVFSAFPERVKAIDEGAPAPKCERALIEKQASDNFIQDYNRIKSNSEKFFDRIAICSGEMKKQVHDCIHRIGTVLKYMCLDASLSDHVPLPHRKPADEK